MPEADYLFEVSWEVCNKVGGIYTVVKSKAKPMLENYKDNYFVVGPYFFNKAKNEFVEERPHELLKKIFDEMQEMGLIAHFGKWIIDGSPNTILIDFSNFSKNKDVIKKKLYDSFKIDSLSTNYYDYDEPIIWSYSVGILLEKFAALTNKKIVGHFHEWLSGGGLLYLKMNNVPVATIFTTHATMLGRTLASANVDLYEKLNEINSIEEAYKSNIQAKHLTESACALNADAFTTVSEITGIEAEHLLGKKSDIILPNGLNMEKFPNFEEISLKHSINKKKYKEFIMHYFFPYYSFDLDETLIYFISARYEFHDKGLDIFLDALSDLNNKLNLEKSKKTVVTFFFIPANVRGIRPEVLENKIFFKDIKDSIEDEIISIQNRIIYGICANKKINISFLFEEELLDDLKRKTLQLAKKGNPPISTHNLFNEENDEIITKIRQTGLTNKEEDRVKIVYYPMYLTGADNLLDLEYYEAMLGVHLGVFPSYYEPWGYTPLEAGALGIASITSDLAGFGRYIQNDTKKENPGIFILKRYGKTYDESRKDLFQTLFDFTMLPKSSRIKNKYEAKILTLKIDWKYLVENYIKAHDFAVKKKYC